MKSTIVKISTVKCQYVYPITLGHETLLEEFTCDTQCVDLRISLAENVFFCWEQVERSNLVYSNDNIFVYKNQHKNEYYITLGVDSRIIANYIPSKKTCQIYYKDTHIPIELPLPLEDFLWTDILSRKNKLVLHGGAASNLNKTFLYFGQSGAGKSTLSSILQKNGFLILSDERIIVSLNSSINAGYWLSSNNTINNLTSTAKNVIYLRHSKDQLNHINRISSEEMFSLLSKQIYYPVWDKKLMLKTILNAQKFSSQVQSYILEFKPDSSIVDYLNKEVN